MHTFIKYILISITIAACIIILIEKEEIKLKKAFHDAILYVEEKKQERHESAPYLKQGTTACALDRTLIIPYENIKDRIILNGAPGHRISVKFVQANDWTPWKIDNVEKERIRLEAQSRATIKPPVKEANFKTEVHLKGLKTPITFDVHPSIITNETVLFDERITVVIGNTEEKSTTLASFIVFGTRDDLVESGELPLTTLEGCLAQNQGWQYTQDAIDIQSESKKMGNLSNQFMFGWQIKQRKTGVIE